jgi:hypothetical protein
LDGPQKYQPPPFVRTAEVQNELGAYPNESRNRPETIIGKYGEISLNACRKPATAIATLPVVAEEYEEGVSAIPYRTNPTPLGRQSA